MEPENQQHNDHQSFEYNYNGNGNGDCVHRRPSPMGTNPKRVSFGNSSGGSMVETLIIDDLPNDNSYCELHGKNNNKYFDDQDGMVPGRPVDTHVKFASGDNECTAVIVTTEETALLQPEGITQDLEFNNYSNSDRYHSSSSYSPSNAKPGPPILRLKRAPSTESRDNPFQADGELAQKAEYILQHSTISRTQLRISDPDLSHSDIGEDEIMCKTENSALNAAPPRHANGTEKGVNAANVEVEVGKGKADGAQPQQAEQVKVKQKKCQCCVVM